MTAHRPFAGGDVLPSTAWHAEFADVNNDGFADLFVAKGNVEAEEGYAARDPSNLLIGQADGTFEEGAEAAGIVGYDRARGAAVVDLDLDGLLDLVVVNRRRARRAVAQHRRRPATWAAVRLRQPAPNVDAVGAWVETRVGDRTDVARGHRRRRPRQRAVGVDPPRPRRRRRGRGARAVARRRDRAVDDGRRRRVRVVERAPTPRPAGSRSERLWHTLAMILDRLDLDADSFHDGNGLGDQAGGRVQGRGVRAAAGAAASISPATAERLGMALVHDEEHDLWALGPESIGGRALVTAEAPGARARRSRRQRRSACRRCAGQKVVLVAWAPY